MLSLAGWLNKLTGAHAFMKGISKMPQYQFFFWSGKLWTILVSKQNYSHLIGNLMERLCKKGLRKVKMFVKKIHDIWVARRNTRKALKGKS